MPRSAAARWRGSLRRRSARQGAAASGGVAANSGRACQRSANASGVAVSAKVASRSSASARARALGVVLDARGGGDEDEPLHPLGRRERGVQRQPPAHGVPGEDQRAGRRVQEVPRARVEPDGPRGGGGAVAAHVGRGDRHAGRQVLAHGVPRAAGAREAVDEDEGRAVGHAAAGRPCGMMHGRARPRRQPPPPARLHRRARAVRRAPRRHVAGLAIHAARPGPRPRAGAAGVVARRRALRRLLRARHGEGRRAPGVVACTSGTAAANLAPAVIEAHEAGVPLVVLTADRPPELREVGAGQTIDQLKLYGTAVRWFVELGVDEATPETLALGPPARLPRGRRGDGRRRRDPGPCTSTSRCASRSSSTRRSRRTSRAAAAVRTAVRGPRSPAPPPRPAAPPVQRRSRSSPGGRAARCSWRAAPSARTSPAWPPRRRASAGRCWPTRLSGARSGPAAIAAYDALLRDPAIGPGTPGPRRADRRPADLQAAAPVAGRAARGRDHAGRVRPGGRLARPGRDAARGAGRGAGRGARGARAGRRGRGGSRRGAPRTPAPRRAWQRRWATA